MSKDTEKRPRTNHLELARRIIEHAQDTGLGDGDGLSEQQLARTFGVSRTLIRAGLDLLLEQQLVAHEPGKGYRLAADPSADLANLESTRAVLLNGVFYDAAALREGVQPAP